VKAVLKWRPKLKRRHSFVFFFVGIPLVVVSGFVVVATLWDIIPYLGSAGWPTARGEVTDVSTSTKMTPMTEWNMYMGRPGHTWLITTWGYIGYRYRVDGEEFYGVRVALASMGSAEKYVSQYRRHQRVKVYFDPNEPTRSLLVPGFTAETFRTLLLLASPLLVGVISTMFGLGLRNGWGKRWHPHE
jgi:hypothetical protein